jgi:non-homologous end joining protein Ku
MCHKRAARRQSSLFSGWSYCPPQFAYALLKRTRKQIPRFGDLIQIKDRLADRKMREEHRRRMTLRYPYEVRDEQQYFEDIPELKSD